MYTCEFCGEKHVTEENAIILVEGPDERVVAARSCYEEEMAEADWERLVCEAEFRSDAKREDGGHECVTAGVRS